VDRATKSGDEKAVSRLLQDEAVKAASPRPKYALIQQARQARDTNMNVGVLEAVLRVRDEMTGTMQRAGAAVRAHAGDHATLGTLDVRKSSPRDVPRETPWLAWRKSLGRWRSARSRSRSSA